MPNGTPAAARVAAVLVCSQARTLVSVPHPAVTLDLGGVVGDRHHGVARPADSRSPRRPDGTRHPRGTPLRNDRQVTLVAAEELERLAERLGLPPVDPVRMAASVGANVLLAEAPDLTAWPPLTRVGAPSGATVVVSGATQPCVLPGRVLQAAYPDVPGLARAFPRKAVGLRGVTAWVERGGVLAAGDEVAVVVPVVLAG